MALDVVWWSGDDVDEKRRLLCCRAPRFNYFSIWACHFVFHMLAVNWMLLGRGDLYPFMALVFCE